MNAREKLAGVLRNMDLGAGGDWEYDNVADAILAAIDARVKEAMELEKPKPAPAKTWCPKCKETKAGDSFADRIERGRWNCGECGTQLIAHPTPAPAIEPRIHGWIDQRTRRDTMNGPQYLVLEDVLRLAELATELLMAGLICNDWERAKAVNHALLGFSKPRDRRLA